MKRRWKNTAFSSEIDCRRKHLKLRNFEKPYICVKLRICTALLNLKNDSQTGGQLTFNVIIL